MNSLQKSHQHLDDCYKEAETDSKKYDIERVRAMVVAYHSHYANDGCKALAIEEPFDLPVIDTKTGKPLGRNYCGVVDAIVELEGKTWFVDHKTTSRLSDDYWTELQTNPQLTHYLLAARQVGIEAAGFLWDVVLKPTIEPKKLPKKSIEEIEAGSYCGFPIDVKDYCDSEGHYNQGEKEPPKLYGLRCLSEYLADPGRFFQRQKVYRNGEQLLDYLTDLNVISQTMDRVAQEERLQYPNRYACKSFGRMCDFHSICRGDDPERLHYRPKGPNPESRQFSKGSLSVSQVGTHLRCRKEWMFRYVDQIEPMRPTYDDSLAMGSMFHKCIEFFLEDRRADRSVSLKSPDTL